MKDKDSLGSSICQDMCPLGHMMQYVRNWNLWLLETIIRAKRPENNYIRGIRKSSHTDNWTQPQLHTLDLWWVDLKRAKLGTWVIPNLISENAHQLRSSGTEMNRFGLDWEMNLMAVNLDRNQAVYLGILPKL